MKTKDLMIGDYVTFKDCQKDDAPTIVKIESLGYQERGVAEGTLVTIDGDKRGFDLVEIDDEFVGIPLTPEILEENGFIKDENEGANGTTYHTLIPTGYDANSYTIQITLYKEPICGVSVLLKIWGWVPPYNAGTNDIHLCSVNYVHELQHALKLCGIEKEITL